jgi:ribosome biogenesis GTPase A
LLFAADSDAARAAAREASFVSIAGQQLEPRQAAYGSTSVLTSPPAAFLVRNLGVKDVRPDDMPQCAGPRRPPWRYDESKQELEAREKLYFDRWLATVARDDMDAAYFEQNLETWRQLWRVVERSDILVLVADIRYPALHFVPGLYDYVTKDLGKGMVLALNKCDLVSEHLLHEWKSYFMHMYPTLAIALFSSYPDEKLAPSNDNNPALLSKRERRMARSRLAAWGADQLLAAINTLSLPPHKREYLEQWRARLTTAPAEDRNSAAVTGSSERHFAPIPSLAVCIDCGCSCSTPAETICKRPAMHRARPRGPGKRRPTVPSLSDDDDGEESSGDDRSDDFHLNDAVDDTDDARWAPGEEDDDDNVLETMITIGIVGHPNAGKSSLINGVFGRKVVSTSATPGHTKHLQTMFLSSHVRLCDCPGLTFPGRVPRELQVIAGMFPISQLREPYAVVKYLADRIPLVSMLDLAQEIPKLTAENEEPFPGPNGWTAWTICEAWAAKRGFRTAKAARLDVYRAANNILRLALDGRLVLATTPPGYSPPMELSDQEKTGAAAVAAKEYGLASAFSSAIVARIPRESRNIDSNGMHDEMKDGRNSFEDEKDDDGDKNEDDDSNESVGKHFDGGMFALLEDQC